MTKQMTKIALMLVLVMGLTASAAMAQNMKGGDLAPVGIYTGIETAEGTIDPISAICYGNSFDLNSYGEWETHHLTVSLNYSINQFVPNNFIVTGGSWSLAVFRENVYAGTLYGEVQSGSLNLITNSNGKVVSKQVQVSLRSSSGLGIFKGKEYKNLGGVYNATTDFRSKETTGNVNFTF
jgi:hypothetical protein